MEKYRQDYLDKVMKSHNEEERETLLESSVMAFNNLPEWDCSWNRTEIAEVIKALCDRDNLVPVYYTDKWEFYSMWTVKEIDSKLKVITRSDWIKLMGAKIGEVQSTIREIILSK